MSKKVTGSAFDVKIFNRLWGFPEIPMGIFIGTFSAILLSLATVARPILLQEIVNIYFKNKDKEGILYFSMLMVIFLISRSFVTVYFHL